MKPSLPNGSATPDRNEPPRDDTADACATAEDLRALLAEATNRAARLVAILKTGRKEKKALAAVWAGLQQLNLGSNGGRL